MNIGITHIRHFSEVRLKGMTNYDWIPVSSNVLSKLSGNRDRLATHGKSLCGREDVKQCWADLLQDCLGRRRVH